MLKVIFTLFLLLACIVFLAVQDAMNIDRQVSADRTYWTSALENSAKAKLISAEFLTKHGNEAQVLSTNFPLVQLRKELEISSLFCSGYVIDMDYSISADDPDQYWSIYSGGLGTFCVIPSFSRTFTKTHTKTKRANPAPVTG